MAALYTDVGHDGSEIINKGSIGGHQFERRGFAFCEITRYLAGKGFNLGLVWDGRMLDGTLMTVGQTYPALLIVKGNTSNHAVIWNGTEVLDPSPHAYANMPLDRYQVKQWWPIVQITQGDI